MKKQNTSLKTKFTGLVAGALMLGATGVQADLINGLVDQWSANVSGQFLCGSSSFNGAGGTCAANTMSWGTSTGSGQSGLDIINPGAPGILNTNGAAVPNLSITHRNQPITGTSLDSVTLRSSLTLTALNPAGPAAALPPFIDFFIDFIETPNGATPCANGGANGVGINGNGCADIFVLSQNILNIPFFYDLDDLAGPLQSQQYFISFFELTGGLNPLSNEACAAAGVAAGCIGFETAEGANTTFQFAAQITTQPLSVPEPATLVLLGIGMLGIGLSARRKA